MTTCIECGSKRVEKLMEYRCPDCGVFYGHHIREDWISVKDRLPEDKGWYLVYKKWKNTLDNHDLVRESYYDKNDCKFDTKAVAHWMPLPEPPESD